MKACTAVRAQFSTYLEGEVTPRQAAYLEAHLRHCTECRAEWARLNDVAAILETEPREEAEIDLYPAFRQRLAEHTSPRWAPRPFPRRAVFAAGMVLVLLVTGSLVGTHVLHERKVYVSTPRQLQPALFSSMAIAAETIQNQDDADGLLLADPRLEALIDVRAKGEPLKDVVEQLARKTQVRLAVAPELADQRIYLRLHDITIADALGEIRRLVSGAWEVSTGEEGKRYTLVAPPQVMKIADAVAQAQAMAVAGEELYRIKTAIETRNPSLLEDSIIGNSCGLLDELQKMQQDPQRTVNPESFAVRYFLLDDDVISTLLAGRKYTRTYTEMTAQGQQFFRDFVNNGGNIAHNPWGTYHLEISLTRRADGSMMLNTGYSSDGGGGSSFGEGIFDILYGQRSTNRLTEESLGRLMQTVQAENPRYADPALAVKLGNGNYQATNPLENKPTYTMLEMLALITRRTNLQVVADVYSVEDRRNRMLPRELTLAELLAVLDKDFNIAWSLDGQKTLRLVHRQWPMLRQTEPDRVVIDQINRHFAQRGILDLDDLCALMRLDDLKYAGTIAASQNDALIGKLSQLRADAGAALKYYAELPPAQQQTARSAGGLSSTALPAEARDLAYQSAYLAIHGTMAGYDPEEMKQPFNFTMMRERATWGDLERRYYRNLLSKEGWSLSEGIGSKSSRSYLPSGPASRTTEHEFVIFRWTGAFDHVTAIQLPVKSDKR
ncbi:MAG: zf-HC2 domain-containing protein [Armatimonadota bacterium]